MRSWLPPGWVLLALGVGLPLAASGYTLTPNLLSLRPAGSESSAFLQLENKQMEPVAVELTVNEHRKDPDGQTVAGPAADNDFLIYPAQLVLMPGDEVAVQVRWISEPILPVERVYTLVTRQVPIPKQPAENSDSGGGVRLHFRVKLNYEVRIYVTPPGAKPKVVVESVTERPTPPGDPSKPAESAQLEVVLVNQGTAHQSLRNQTLVFAALDSAGTLLRAPTVAMAAKDIPGLTPHLLAGDRRRLVIPRPAGLPAGPVRVTLSE